MDLVWIRSVEEWREYFKLNPRVAAIADQLIGYPICFRSGPDLESVRTGTA